MHIYHRKIQSKIEQNCQDKKKKQFPLAVFASQHFINRVSSTPPNKLIRASTKFKIRLTGFFASLAVSLLMSTAASCLKYSCSDAELLSLDGPHHVQHLFLMSCALLCARKCPYGVSGIFAALAVSRHTHCYAPP